MEDVIKGRRFCYVISQGSHNSKANRKEWGGYMPSLVVEGESGHYPMQGGDHEWAVPWIWGKTLREAKKTCASYNKRRGLSKEDVVEITYSSFQRQSAEESFPSH